MNLDDYRSVFVACCLALMLIVAAPTLALVVPFPNGSERFSELWLLGPNHMAEDYPFNVHVNESQSIFVGVGNHVGVSSYYLVYVKFRNQTQPLPNNTISEPSPLAPLYEFRPFVRDGGTWETPLTFKFLRISFNTDSAFITRIVFNDEVFVVNASSRWDPVNKGFYFQLLFELWLYNVASQSFQFNNRFVGIWVNATG